MKKDRNQNGIPIKDAINGYFKALGIDDKMIETGVLSKWESIVGKPIAQRTIQKYIREKTLYLEMNSSVMRDELQHLKEEIITKVNEAAGKELITTIFLK